MATKKYLSLERLTEYDELIKAKIDDGDASVKSYVDTEVAKKANSSHTHDDRYYTESEIDSKLSTVNTSITNITSGTTPVKKAEHATSADSATSATSATKATQDGNGKVISSTYETKTDASAKLTEAKEYATELNDSVAESFGNIILGMYGDDYTGETPEMPTIREIANDEADTALASAKSYADEKIANLLDNSTEAVDSIMELAEAMKNNADAIDALETIASGKADKTHSHAISDVSGLQSALDEKANASHTHTVANITDLTATATELNYMDGVTSNVQTQLDGKASSGHSHNVATTSASGFMTADMVTKLNGIATGANKTTVDSSLSSSSTNPVQNKVVNSAISTLTSTVSTNTSSINSHTTAINNLQTSINDIQEITSAEVLALFGK